MDEQVAIEAVGLGKSFTLYDSPAARLRELVAPGGRRHGRRFEALHDVTLRVGRGEVVGIVGRNGAGKSTLLQLVCGTLAPSEGTLRVRGRVAALLELGAGFNPEFSGRENVWLNASILGLTDAQIAARFDDIVAFAGLSAFIDQPVKTYSSGMFVRLAFAVATSVEPDILVIDEALSVGDGAFARKSFERIMAMKDAGATILFCSHSMYHIEALCARALWLEGGRVRMLDEAPRVTHAYNTALLAEAAPGERPAAHAGERAGAAGGGRIVAIEADCDGTPGTALALRSGESTLRVRVRYALAPGLPPPSVGLGIENAAGMAVSSLSTFDDGVALRMDERGTGEACVYLERVPLRRGEYRVAVFLACERGLQVYDWVRDALRLTVSQADLGQGVVSLPHRWLVHETPGQPA